MSLRDQRAWNLYQGENGKQEETLKKNSTYLMSLRNKGAWDMYQYQHGKEYHKGEETQKDFYITKESKRLLHT